MKNESVKSGILVFLVALSVLLYYLLWTDQVGEFDAIGNSSSTMAQEKLGDKKEVSEVVKPDEIYQHIDGIHYGTISKVEIDAIINKLKEFEYADFRNVTSSVDGIANFLEEQDNSLALETKKSKKLLFIILGVILVLAIFIGILIYKKIIKI